VNWLIHHDRPAYLPPITFHTCELRPTLRFWIGFCLAAASLLSLGFAHADPADDSLRLYAVDIWQDPPQSWGPGRGVYLGNGLVITAAHVVAPVARTKPSVRIAGMDLPATAIREGNFERMDLTLLSIDEQKLPINLQMRRMPLCEKTPWPGEPVIVAIPEETARSHIMSPLLLPFDVRRRFSTVIRDVATTGNSGSGVFDAGQKCLLGIMSRKISVRPNDADAGSEQKDIAKYFVPASAIRTFIPANYRF
jgi:Trypsin-like peptidase domain